jgi:hypothetical protein
MRRLDLKPLTALTAVALFVGVGLASCTQTEAVVFREGPPAPAAFSPADASAEAAAEPVDVTMCPVTTCSLPLATCPSSAFPCDVDLMNDDDNCGGCGIRCGGNNYQNSKWSCVQGQCVFGCVGDGWHDCDNNTTNGCEVRTHFDVNNCGACGKACAPGEVCGDGRCVDPCVRAGLPDRCGATCKNLRTDDFNCGACGVECDRAAPGLPALPDDMYYGCSKGQCGASKCSFENWRNCNSDPSDGCEVQIFTNENCGGCGDACPAGKSCEYDINSNWYRCLCDGGETNCGGYCTRLDDNPWSCGACGYACPGIDRPHFVATCRFGVCAGRCEDKYADCDRIGDNGCEINIYVDNRNCGACGNACAPNQVCSGGKCLVAPCESEGPPTK